MTYQRRMRRGTVAMIVLAGVGLTGSALGDVLIAGAPVGGQAWLDDVAEVIDGTGKIEGAIDTFNIHDGTPTLGQLKSYDSVLVFTDRTLKDPTLLGNNLADYVDSGGGVVLMTFYWSPDPGGRFATWSKNFRAFSIVIAVTSLMLNFLPFLFV